MIKPLTPIKPKTLTSKQRAFVDQIVNNPKQSATQAVLKTYGKDGKPPTYASARNIATENLAKPIIITELSKYNNMVENVLINTINDWGSENNTRKREIAVDTAKYIHDKIHGRAIQQIQSTTNSISLNIDLTSSLTDTEQATEATQV